jgi:hypothetical protein
MSLRSVALLSGLTAIAVIAGCESSTAPVPSVSPSASQALASRANAGPATPVVFATGLQYPRGLNFGPDGNLYVAEAGSGGTSSTTAAQCTQVIPPIGPYTNGPTGRISRIDANGVRTTVAQGFPSALNAAGDVLGVADVAFIGHEMYALLAGGGCSHGSPRVPASVARVHASGAWSVVANLSRWEQSHPAAHPNPADFEPDGSWYSMISAGQALIALEPNQGDMVLINHFTGSVTRIADISKTQGHSVPTVVAERRGALYVSSLGVFPSTPGSQSILRVSPRGKVSVVATGFTAVLGLDFDRRGRLYVLEMTTVAGFPTPGTGRVVRLDHRGRRVVIVDGLFLPTSARFGPDGRLYISNKGFGPPQPGEILRVDVPGVNDGDFDDDMEYGR